MAIFTNYLSQNEINHQGSDSDWPSVLYTVLSWTPHLMHRVQLSSSVWALSSDWDLPPELRQHRVSRFRDRDQNNQSVTRWSMITLSFNQDNPNGLSTHSCNGCFAKKNKKLSHSWPAGLIKHLGEVSNNNLNDYLCQRLRLIMEFNSITLLLVLLLPLSKFYPSWCGEITLKTLTTGKTMLSSKCCNRDEVELLPWLHIWSHTYDHNLSFLS